jgi:hypothetical protein
MEKTKKYQAHVRFSDEELERITHEAKELRSSVPDLLKSTYFRRVRLRILMTRTDADQVIRLLLQACNGLSKIHQGIASGLVTGINDEMKEIGRLITGVMALMNAHAFRRR